ncbi:AAA family ATPase [Microbispora sp. NPDC049633]|uniref:AAA family ATPase n=1 Tax=Microbispora sp. NPDC049633 TaxID=3154355 RepID=UPI0034198DFA
MIIWLNGTFGVGKTTTAAELVRSIPRAHFFDPEQVGVMLTHATGLPKVGDFQDWTLWRTLVVETVTRLAGQVGGVLVLPQTVLVEDYWREIRAGLEAAGVPLRHFVLHADRATLLRRIEGDTPSNSRWRLDHLTAYQDALPWLRREGRLVDTTGLPPAGVAAHIAATVAPDQL